MQRKVRLITYSEKGQEFVSHGIDEDTLQTVILPPDPVASFSPKRDILGFYVILGEAA